MPSPQSIEYQRWYAQEQIEQAARKQAAEVEPALRDLRRLRVKLEKLEAQRLELVASRSAAVARARGAGATWATVTEAAGVSRPSLIEAEQR